MSLAERAGSQLAVEGVARDAAAGAVVITKDGPVYVAGLAGWDEATLGQHVIVRGTLRVEAGGAQVTERGEHVHGVPGDRFVLEAATWSLAR